MSILAPKEEDIQKMLAAQCHIGTRNSDHMMEEYIWRRRQDGVHIINIGHKQGCRHNVGVWLALH